MPDLISPGEARAGRVVRCGAAPARGSGPGRRPGPRAGRGRRGALRRAPLRQLGDGRLRGGGRRRRPSWRCAASRAPATRRPKRRAPAWPWRSPRARPIPDGADAVVPVERTEPAGDGRVRVGASEPGANMRRAGEDLRARPGRAARRRRSWGRPSSACSPRWAATARGARVRPRVALLVTGDELAEPGEPLEPGQIHSSNASALAGAGRPGGRGGRPCARGCPTTARPPRPRSAPALDSADVVLVSGGVSVGPHDHVKPALAALGRGGALLARRAEAGQADLVRHARPHAGLRPARQPGVGHGLLPALRAPRPARPAGRRPRRRARTRPGSRSRGRPTRRAPRPSAAACAPTSDGLAGRAHRRPGLAPPVLDAGRRRPGAGRPAARTSCPPGPTSSSSFCDGERAVLDRVRPRDPRRLLARPALRPRAREDRAGARVRRLRGRQRDHQADGRGHAPARGARPDLVAGVPRAPGPHLLALPLARLAGRPARALHRGRARDRRLHPAVRAAALPQARVRDRRRTAAWSPGRSRRACWCSAAGAARASCASRCAASPRRSRATPRSARSAPRWRTSTPRSPAAGSSPRIGRAIYRMTQFRIHIIVTHAFLRSLARMDLEESKGKEGGGRCGRARGSDDHDRGAPPEKCTPRVAVTRWPRRRRRDTGGRVSTAGRRRGWRSCRCGAT